MRYIPKRVLFLIKALHYSYALKRFSERDEPDLMVVKYIVKSGNTVIDVGANVWWYTKVLSGLVGNKGRVISLEPMPETFALLSKCVKYHGLSNVELFNV